MRPITMSHVAWSVRLCVSVYERGNFGDHSIVNNDKQWKGIIQSSIPVWHWHAMRPFVKLL